MPGHRACDDVKNTPLHWALYTQPPPPFAIIQQLVEMEPAELGRQNRFGLTPLHFALGCSVGAPPVDADGPGPCG
jgi:ankyrin repeat protein